MGEETARSRGGVRRFGKVLKRMRVITKQASKRYQARLNTQMRLNN